MTTERLLYHVWLSPFSRKIILALGEKKLAYKGIIEKVWERRQEFYALNCAGQVPVLVDEDGTVIADSNVLVEYLEEVYPEVNLLGKTPAERAEARRITAWFDQKFNKEVTANLLDEKVFRRLFSKGTPNSMALRAGAANITYHLDYITFLVDRRKWLAGDELTVADLAAAAHLSALDYLGHVPWEQHEITKEWYSRVKSRPSFRPLLQERMPALAPVPHYADLDF